MSFLLPPWHTPWGMLFFSSPLFLLAAVPFAALLAWQVWGRKKNDTIPVSELSYLRLHAGTKSFRKYLRAGFACLCALLVAVLLAGPRMTGELALPLSTSKQVSKQYIVLFDVSTSMQEPMRDNVGKNRYDAAREAFRAFVEDQKDERTSVVLFTDIVFLVMHPTHDPVLLEDGILDVQFAPLGQRGESLPPWLSQISVFSLISGGNTNIAKAMLAAASFAERQDEATRGRVFIVISDLDDNLYQVESTARELLDKGARVYFFGIEANNAPELQERLSDNLSARVFSLKTSRDLRAAFDEVSRQERIIDNFSPSFLVYEADLRPWAAGMFLALFIVLCVLSEGVWLMARGENTRIKRTVPPLPYVLRKLIKTRGA